MDIKKAYSLTFSPTGGTKKIAEHIASAVCERSEFLDVTVKAQDTDFGAEDFVVIAVPVFGGGCPRPWRSGSVTSARRIRPRPSLRCTATAPTRTRCWSCAAMAEAGASRSWPPGAFIARHSIVPEFGEGRPDAADYLKMDEFARRIRDRLDFVASPTPADGDSPRQPRVPQV